MGRDFFSGKVLKCSINKRNAFMLINAQINVLKGIYALFEFNSISFDKREAKCTLQLPKLK